MEGNQIPKEIYDNERAYFQERLRKSGKIELRMELGETTIGCYIGGERVPSSLAQELLHLFRIYHDEYHALGHVVESDPSSLRLLRSPLT